MAAAEAPLVTLASGDPTSFAEELGIFCSASIVADCGGVFSPRMLCVCLRIGRLTGVRLVDTGVEVEERVFSWSADLDSVFSSLPFTGVEGLLPFSGDLGVESREPSMSILRSRTLPGCNDCIRLCEPFLGIIVRSGEVSLSLFVNAGMRAFSLAFSVRAACAD